jgi:pyrroloquinoline quinone (PQQ) biosynthesis protein C
VAIHNSKPLPATEALNGYLYHVALKEGLVARLGYSFWAEDAYEHIQPILASARQTFGLTDDRMTFFVAHSSIDEKHSKEVREAISTWAVTAEEREAVKRVARTTLYLTGQILEAAHAESTSSTSAQRRTLASDGSLHSPSVVD